jgi:hypothetical protein
LPRSEISSSSSCCKWKRIRNDDEKFRFQGATNKPKKENKVQGESVEQPISTQFWLQARDAERERERERERK